MSVCISKSGGRGISAVCQGRGVQRLADASYSLVQNDGKRWFVIVAKASLNG